MHWARTAKNLVLWKGRSIISNFIRSLNCITQVCLPITVNLLSKLGPCNRINLSNFWLFSNNWLIYRWFANLSLHLTYSSCLLLLLLVNPIIKRALSLAESNKGISFFLFSLRRNVSFTLLKTGSNMGWLVASRLETRLLRILKVILYRYVLAWFTSTHCSDTPNSWNLMWRESWITWSFFLIVRS